MATEQATLLGRHDALLLRLGMFPIQSVVTSSTRILGLGGCCSRERFDRQSKGAPKSFRMA